ncbi:ParB N-terminal domain-containing protein [bacterium]|nr:ParB N-terminal domain-containing protein [bacterium]
MSSSAQQHEEEYTFHALANAFPLMSDHKLDELKEDIQKNGLLEPITATADGQIIDGRNRYLACKALGVQPKIEVLLPETDLEQIESLIASRNIRRRHESEEDLEATYLRFQAEGKSIRAIAAKEGKSKSEIGRIVKKAKAKSKGGSTITLYRGGLPRGGSAGGVDIKLDPHLTDAQREAIHKDLRQRKTIKETARRNKVSETTIKREKKKIGLNGRGGGGNINKKTEPVLLNADQEKEIAAHYKAGQLGRYARRYRLNKDQAAQIASRVMRDEHPAEMIEHLRGVYSPENTKKFDDACNDYALSPQARNAIANYLENAPFQQPIKGDGLFPDVTSLQLVFSDLFEETFSKFQYLSEMSKEDANRVLSLYAFLLDLAPQIKRLDEYFTPPTISDRFDDPDNAEQSQPAEAEADLAKVSAD